mmetsp:Transcript_8372/g.20060  ORF Transcript_8372/g.20060 Transcript_8372/m.20060 type:complete len:320 (+) Transcript_8372:240-1199(+)
MATPIFRYSSSPPLLLSFFFYYILAANHDRAFQKNTQQQPRCFGHADDVFRRHQKRKTNDAALRTDLSARPRRFPEGVEPPRGYPAGLSFEPGTHQGQVRLSWIADDSHLHQRGCLHAGVVRSLRLADRCRKQGRSHRPRQERRLDRGGGPKARRKRRNSTGKNRRGGLFPGRSRRVAVVLLSTTTGREQCHQEVRRLRRSLRLADPSGRVCCGCRRRREAKNPSFLGPRNLRRQGLVRATKIRNRETHERVWTRSQTCFVRTIPHGTPELRTRNEGLCGLFERRLFRERRRRQEDGAVAITTSGCLLKSMAEQQQHRR